MNAVVAARFAPNDSIRLQSAYIGTGRGTNHTARFPPGWPCCRAALFPDMVAEMRNIAWVVSAISVSIAVSAMSWAQKSPQIAGQTDWPTYGNDAGGSRYSAAAQINRSNVNGLKVAWTYRTGANETPTRMIRKAAFEATPILVDGKLFLSTPYNHVIALDPGTGAKLWEYDPGVNLDRNYSEVSSRGVSAWR